ncbi:MAG: peptidase M22 [Clostridia bacterium]|nr:peptidase M22 [Clostridia bacterium]
MSYILGIDTSNYTTSMALCSSDGRIISNQKMLLPVKEGERGLRQSDAVFAHTVNLPKVAEMLGKADICAVGYSAFPRDNEGSYMPCFLCGKAYAESLSALLDIPCVAFSHQRGHIRAALYSSEAEHLLGSEYLAFHLSGGTTEVLHVKNGGIELIGGTNDLTAGQAIDRIGVMMGLAFPCGAELEKLAELGSANKCKISVKGYECNMSGLENLASRMYKDGASKEDVAAFTMDFVLRTLDKMTENLLCDYPGLPLVYSGGVMSNKRIKNYFKEKYGAYFAEPAFSSDNAAGTALLAYDKLKDELFR